MKVYGIVLSPFVRKVLAVCSLKGLEYEHEPVMPGSATPEYLLISPLGKVPAFEDGDLGVSDSSVICEYLEEKYPAGDAFPKTAAYLERVKTHPAMMPVLAAERETLAALFPDAP